MKNLKKLIVLAIASVMLISLCACGGGGDDATDGGTLTVALGDAPNYLDPAIAGDSVSMGILANLYFPLFIYDKDGNVINEAVETYEVSTDGLTYTLHLRAGDKWSDGKDVTAEDFVYGLKRSLGYGADCGYSNFITDHIVGAADNYGKDIADMQGVGYTALDEKTIEIKLIAPCPYFISKMINGVFFPIRSDFAQEHTSAWANDPAVPTNGPFQLSAINESEKAEVVKNDNYIYADKVSLAGIKFLFMSDQDAQQLSFQTGEIDVALNVGTNVFTTYKDKPELVIAKPYVINYFVLFNPAEVPEAEVRKALAMAINRNDVLVALDVKDSGAYYELYGFVPEGIPGKNGDFCTEVAQVEKWNAYDPEAAKAILAKYGYNESNPLKLTYYYNNSATHTTVAQVFKSQWAAIGVDVELKTADVQTFFQDRSDGKFQMARHANSADYLDPMIYLEMYKTTSQDPAVCSDAKYDKMLDDANDPANDHATRMKLLHEAEEYLVNELAWVIPIYGYANPYLISTKVSGFEADPSGQTMFRYTKLEK
ncbi:MAG: peptide ABC transporter substrate-binding protein [Eubacteriaceae bacterium]|nr:peptide ABC transporter substrate-binding protein [Eubacteriaceae bacterium]